MPSCLRVSGREHAAGSPVARRRHQILGRAHNNGNNNKNALLGADRHAAAALRQREHERAEDQGRASGNLKPGARAEPRLRAARLRPQHARGMLHLHGCPSHLRETKNGGLFSVGWFPVSGKNLLIFC